MSVDAVARDADHPSRTSTQPLADTLLRFSAVRSTVLADQHTILCGASPLIISIDPGQRRPIYLQIMDEVRRGRVVGALQPGDLLPSVRQLATELGVNPNTVKQAYRELEREGVVHMRRGQGTFASDMTVNGAERKRMLREVAKRALRDAQRHGAATEELIESIREAARPKNTEAGG
jgi:GntR family transcriptional regulator